MPGIELRIDVAPRLGGSEPLQIASTIFLPPAEALSSPPIAIFAVPGGGYSRGYFDLHFPGHAGYSEAEDHVARGFIFVACDPVGVGERDVCPDPHAEPTAYRRSDDVTVCRIPRMAHMHNFASTRAQLWRRIDSWSQDVAQRKAR